MQSLSPRLGFLWSAGRVQAGVSGEVLRMQWVAKRKEGRGVCITPTLQPVPVTFPASAHASSMLQALRVNPLVPGLKPCTLLPPAMPAELFMTGSVPAPWLLPTHSGFRRIPGVQHPAEAKHTILGTRGGGAVSTSWGRACKKHP